MPVDCDIHMTLPARAENVALVRHVVGALAEALHMPRQSVEDVKLAVTEACTNVVRHAYAEDGGDIDVAAAPSRDCLSVVVSDQGCGLEAPSDGGPGLGLPLIEALADGLEIDDGPQRGSRLRMSFRPPGGTFRAA